MLRTKITYSSAQLISDTGFLFEDTSTTNFLEFESLVNSVNPVDSDDDKYGSMITFSLSRGFRKYKRGYTRFSDALANVGGIMSLFQMVLTFSFSYYLDIAYMAFLQDNFLILNKEIVPINQVQKIEINTLKPKDISKIDFKDASQDDILKEKQPDTNKPKEELFKLNLALNNKDIVLNKEIIKLINHKKHQLEYVKFGANERCFYTYCCYKNGSNEENNLNFKLLKAANKEIDKRLEILDFIKVMDQLRLLQKIILNENQCFMLQNRELHRVIDTKIYTDDEEAKMKEEKESESRKKLLKYLATRKTEDSLSSTDKLLFNYMEENYKNEINELVGID